MLLFSLLASASIVEEYVAMGPGFGGGPDSIANTAALNSSASRTLKWVKISYDTTSSSASSATMSFVPASPNLPELGKWQDLAMPGLALTARVLDDKLYLYLALKPASNQGGGCCADTLRVVDRVTGTAVDVDLDTAITQAVGAGKQAHATHTFDVVKNASEAGGVVVYCNVHFVEKGALGSVLSDGVVALALSSPLTTVATVIPTASGAPFWNIWEAIGTLDTALNASVFKVQYYKSTASPEEWHGNGVTPFKSIDGIRYISITHRFAAESVVVKDPFVYSDGGKIVQRFGTPKHFTGDGTGAITYRKFGVPTDTLGWSGGVHNTFYTSESPSAALKGAESISLFVNSDTSNTHSFAFEFAFKPVHEDPAKHDYNDATFDTLSTHSALGYLAQAQGGVRIIGDGVFLCASGVVPGGPGAGSSKLGGGGFEIADASGAVASYVDLLYGATAQIYDPYIRVVKGDA